MVQTLETFQLQVCRLSIQDINLNNQLNHVFIAHTSMYITQEYEGVSKGQGLDVEVPAVCPLCYRLRFPRAFRDHSPELFGFSQEKHDFSAFREKLKRLGYRLSAIGKPSIFGASIEG